MATDNRIGSWWREQWGKKQRGKSVIFPTIRLRKKNMTWHHHIKPPFKATLEKTKLWFLKQEVHLMEATMCFVLLTDQENSRSSSLSVHTHQPLTLISESFSRILPQSLLILRWLPPCRYSQGSVICFLTFSLTQFSQHLHLSEQTLSPGCFRGISSATSPTKKSYRLTPNLLLCLSLSQGKASSCFLSFMPEMGRFLFLYLLPMSRSLHHLVWSFHHPNVSGFWTPFSELIDTFLEEAIVISPGSLQSSLNLAFCPHLLTSTPHPHEVIFLKCHFMCFHSQ